MGNGIALIRGIDQYVGLISTPTGSQMILRSGDNGVKIDKNGISMLNYAGAWDNSGLLCGYRVFSDGTLLSRFGVKDKGSNKCNRVATGRYTFLHDIGHTNYTVSVALMSGKYDYFRVPSVDVNTTTIEIRNSSGEYTDRDFIITFFGKM